MNWGGPSIGCGRLAFLVIGALLTAPVAGGLQASGQSTAPSVPPRALDGPPAPVLPEVVSRDASGRMTIRAVRLTTPLRIDGAFRSIRYQPGSELFVVYNDERDTRLSGFPEISTRALIVKVNRLFRF